MSNLWELHSATVHSPTSPTVHSPTVHSCSIYISQVGCIADRVVPHYKRSGPQGKGLLYMKGQAMGKGPKLEVPGQGVPV